MKFAAGDANPDGGDGVFDNANDTIYALSRGYVIGATQITLDIAAGTLADGEYRLTISPTDSLRDQAGIPLDGDADGFVAHLNGQRVAGRRCVGNAQLANQRIQSTRRRHCHVGLRRVRHFDRGPRSAQARSQRSRDSGIERRRHQQRPVDSSRVTSWGVSVSFDGTGLLHDRWQRPSRSGRRDHWDLIYQPHPNQRKPTDHGAHPREQPLERTDVRAVHGRSSLADHGSKLPSGRSEQRRSASRIQFRRRF